MKRTIAVITGSRAEFGIITPIIKAIQDSPRLTLKLVVTGQHLLKKCGYTITNVRSAFPIAAIVPVFQDTSSLAAQSEAIGRGIIKFTKVFSDIRPDIVLVTGDRGEMLAPAIAAVHLNIPVAHYVGGEKSRGIDEPIRHAITKFAHIHFVKTPASRKRVIQLGEKPENIFVVGFSGLDTIYNTPRDQASILRKLNLDPSKPILVVLQHPVTTQSADAGKQMEQTMRAITRFNLQSVVLYPNADAGSADIISIINKHKNKNIRVVRHIPYGEYLSLLSAASVLIGNSSALTVEALPFRLPGINVGDRQQGRERTKNIIDVPYSAPAIIRAVKKALYDKRWRTSISHMKNQFGDGAAGRKIVHILEIISLEGITDKQITY